MSPRAGTARRDVRTDLRVMAVLSVAVTAAIGCTAPAALPLDQSQAWASGRYLDGMIIVFFLAGAVLLLRAGLRPILACAACVTALFGLAAVTVAVYAGWSVPTSGFGSGFNFAEPAVLTLNWTQASVPLASAVTLGLLAVWIGFAAALRRWRVPALPVAFGVCVAAVSLFAVTEMTSHVSQAGNTNVQAANALLRASGLRPGEHIAVASNLSWPLWMPQAFEISWTEVELFTPGSQSLPAGVSVVETPWPAGQPARAGWPDAPAGWRIVASDQANG